MFYGAVFLTKSKGKGSKIVETCLSFTEKENIHKNSNNKREQNRIGDRMTRDLTFGAIREINTMSILLRFGLCILCGGLIGLERETKHRAAGFRTHILVCTGATVVMLTGQYIHNFISENADPSRLGAQVISGIGFLGVGTIIVTKSAKVRGLTTAAGLWTAACIGIAIGIGFYEVAILGTITVLIATVGMLRIDEFFYQRSSVLNLYIEVNGIETVKKLLQMIKENGYHISSFEMQKPKWKESRNVGITIVIRKKDKKNKMDILGMLSNMEEIVYLEEVG